jgi:hypothetical protein
MVDRGPAVSLRSHWSPAAGPARLPPLRSLVASRDGKYELAAAPAPVAWLEIQASQAVRWPGGWDYYSKRTLLVLHNLMTGDP